MSGPASYANWKRANQKAELQGGYETAIFTDARILGMVMDGYGPYQFLNTVPLDDDPGIVRPAVVLRVELYGKFDQPDFQKTEEAAYHAGWLDDELAAVLSLCLGIRAQSGDRTREFGKNDLRGLPCGARTRPDPVLPPFHRRGVVIPSAIREHNLSGLKPFVDFPELNPDAAVAVIRAARLFQQGLWIVESDQNLAWIMFSSAIETAANYWRAAEDAPVARLNAWNSKLADRISKVGGSEFLAEVATTIAPMTGATKKFLDFLQAFSPAPPDSRPPGAYQIDWSTKGLKNAFSKVYAYRSRALHTGIPFPSPMGWAPIQVGNTFAEKMPGGAGTGVHSWSADDLPIQLNIFEYIVRQSLLNWWKSLPRGEQQAAVALPSSEAAPPPER